MMNIHRFLSPVSFFLFLSPSPIHSFGNSRPRIPTSPAQRNNQMAQAVAAAVRAPRSPSLRLIECEFPAVSALNKLGDGSLQSAQAVENANIAACVRLVQTLSFPPIVSPPVSVVLSRTATQRCIEQVQRQCPQVVVSAKTNIRPQPRDVLVFLTPAGSADYQEAKRLAMNGNTVVLVNGFAKVGARRRVDARHRLCMPIMVQRHWQ